MDTDLRDFACPACWGCLPGFPVHGEHGTYCSEHCREWAEGTLVEDAEEQD